MKLDGPAVQYLLSRDFDGVVGDGLPKGKMYDYPILYDVSVDMAGHVVLVPSHERPSNDRDMTDTLCVCVSEEAARSALEAGAAVVTIRGAGTFQHLYNRMQHVFVENERLDAQLHALVDTFAGFQPLLDAFTRAMGYPCTLIDDQFRIVCRSSPQDVRDTGEDGSGRNAGTRRAQEARAPGNGHAPIEFDPLDPDSIDLFMGSREYRYMRTSRSVFTMPSSGNLMMKNVFFRGDLVGSLVIEHKGNALSARYVRFLLNYLNTFVEDAYSRIGSFGVSSIGASQVKAAIRGALSGNGADYTNLQAALVEDGHAPGCDYVMLRIERSFTNEGSGEREHLMRRLELAWPHAYCFAFGNELFMLVDVSGGAHGGKEGFAKELPLVARENLSKMGISRAFGDMKNLDAAVAQARIALECGSERDPMNWCYRFGDYAFWWLVERAVGDVPPEFVCHPAVTVLLRYDDEHGTELLHTLSTFVKCRYNATTASRELYVARSTLLHRLDRIEELVKVDFDNPGDMAYLALSLAMAVRL